MKNSLPANLLFIGIIVFLCSFLIPKGWRISGSAPDKYELGLFKINGHEGKACGVIRASKKEYFGDEYASLIQTISSQNYLGKRIKMTGYMKSRGVTAWAGFYLRVDKEGSKEPISFDNMHDRPIKNNTNWTQYAIELDVPLNASKITFGALLHGPGQVWFDDINFEEVGPSTIVVTDVMCDTSQKRLPENLGFED
ncbi:hypothetical protein CJD36_006705 [Flavipsychrobacter stenotrophus]|uniref:CBM-cenC domain-containing protein n=1 Tax=Flavipsychrobacter stenotrophus TaxID=2077091 RepID=A0A2S7SXX8_9BACT|nr:hypothetical protein [Flavipsychrobacter stenotrophus]PQJ11487.1 hypothetical protein CJD36_006705 [Flavipsychrobacter stenotrophus]